MDPKFQVCFPLAAHALNHVESALQCQVVRHVGPNLTLRLFERLVAFKVLSLRVASEQVDRGVMALEAVMNGLPDRRSQWSDLIGCAEG
jgi:hypothetical protein